MENNSASMYREDILELYKNPINFGKLKSKTHSATKNNPTCGDEIRIEMSIKDKRINEIKFSGVGCAISTAASSLLTQKVKNMSVDYVNNLNQEDVIKLLGIPVSPGRIKCATICLDTIKEAMKGK